MLLMAGYAGAHHSLGGTYSLDRQQVLHGTLKSFLYRNPHSFLTVEAADESGRMQEWQIEWSPAGVLGTQGISGQTLKTGDQLEIAISPGRNPAEHRGLIKNLRRASDGFEWGTKPGEEVPNWAAQKRAPK